MNAIDVCIGKFVPRQLPADQWALVADLARSVVRDADPTGPDDARHLLSRLCIFLAGSAVWDHRTVPDLARLLTEDSIHAHCQQLLRRGLKPGTVMVVRSLLRRVAAAAAGLPRRRRQPGPDRTARARGDRRLEALLALATSVSAATQAWKVSTGRLPSDLLLAWAARHTQKIADDWATLAALVDAPVGPGPDDRAVTSRPRQAAPRPESRAAALREARAAIAMAGRLKAGPQIAPPPTDLPSDVTGAIAAYRPSGVPDERWALIAGMWARLMAGYRPPTARRVTNFARHITDFLLWTLHQAPREDTAAPLTAAELLTPGLIDAWVATLDTVDTTKATQRSTVRRALRSLTADADERQIAHQSMAAPYTPEDCADLRHLANFQPTVGRRKSLAFIVGLAGGAGLDGQDLRSLRRGDIRETHLPSGKRILLVDVGEPRPRTTVVRDIYTPLVDTACRLHDELIGDPSALVIGHKRDRRNVTAPAIDSAVTAVAGEKVPIHINRLRSAWLLALLTAPVPLDSLLRVAGLKSARTITELLPYCPPVPHEQLLELLAQAGEGAVAAS